MKQQYIMLDACSWSRGPISGLTKIRAYRINNGWLVYDRDIKRTAKRLDDTDIGLPEVTGKGWWGQPNGLFAPDNSNCKKLVKKL